MSDRNINVTSDYGWSVPGAPNSCGYIAPKILKIIFELAGPLRICDIGSGNGVLAARIKSSGNYVCGVEYDRSGCEISRRSLPDINFYNLGVHDDPSVILEHEAPFDVCVSTEVIEHLYSPHQLPRFAKKILNKDGVLIISTPYHGFLKNLLLSLANKWDDHFTALWHGGHIKFWSRKTLTKLLSSEGFEVIGFHGVARFPLIWKSMIIVAKVK